MMTSGGTDDIGLKIFKKLSNAIRLTEQRFVVDYVENPFGILVAIILSQNTNDKNSIAATKRLKERIGLTPDKIAKTSLSEIIDAIRPAGLIQQKAKRIKKLADLVINGKLNIDKILNMDVEDARRELIKIEGIGPKTADVFLALFGKKTFGIDTHATRVAKRLGIVSNKASYEDIRRAYLQLFKSVENLDLAHRYIIALGRIWCKAKNPKCKDCPIKEFCEYWKNKKEGLSSSQSPT